MKFYDCKEKDSVLQNCKKLKGSSISISNDYAKETVAVRKKLWESAAVGRANGKKVTLLGDKIKVDEEIYSWDTTRNERCPYQNRRDKAHQGRRFEASTSQNVHPSYNKTPCA